MSKYNPLWSRVGKSKEVSLQLSFEEIEEVLGFPVDHSFLKYKKELSAYGWSVQIISMKKKTVLFHRQKGWYLKFTHWNTGSVIHKTRVIQNCTALRIPTVRTAGIQSEKIRRRLTTSTDSVCCWRIIKTVQPANSVMQKANDCLISFSFIPVARHRQSVSWQKIPDTG